MKTYKITYKLKGDSAPRIKYIPSFSEDEARIELEWLIRTCYDQTPQILEITEMSKLGGNTTNATQSG